MDTPAVLPVAVVGAPGLRAELARGARAAVPVMLGFLPFALVLRAQAAQKGLSALEVPLMTGLNFGGGSEFAAVELWTSPPHVLAIVAVTLLKIYTGGYSAKYGRSDGGVISTVG